MVCFVSVTTDPMLAMCPDFRAAYGLNRDCLVAYLWHVYGVSWTVFMAVWWPEPRMVHDHFRIDLHHILWSVMADF